MGGNVPTNETIVVNSLTLKDEESHKGNAT